MAQSTPIGVGGGGDKVLYAGFWGKPWVLAGLLEESLPDLLVTKLHPNFPNPFTSSTTVIYSLAGRTEVTLRVFSVEGRTVRTLVSGKESPGLHQVLWNGRDDMGKDVGPGVYFCRLEAGPHSAVKKMVVLK